MPSPPLTLSQATVRNMTMLEQLESSYRLLSTYAGEAAAAAEGGSSASAQDIAQLENNCRHSSFSQSDALDTRAMTADATASQPPVGPQEEEPRTAEGIVGEDGSAQRRQSHSLASLQARDVAAVGALIVQLYTCRLHHVRSTDAQYWRGQIKYLPSAAGRVAAACLGDNAAGDVPSTGQLLRNAFFTEAVRRAAEFLSGLQPPSLIGDGGCRSARSHGQGQLDGIQGVTSKSEQACEHLLLAQLAESGGILSLHKTPEALRICLPTIVRLLEAAALQPADEQVGGLPARQNSADGQHEAGSMASAFVTVYRQLLQCLHQHEVQQECVPLWQRVIRGRPREGQTHGLEKRALTFNMKLQAALLQRDLLRSLLACVGLTSFLDNVQSHILDIVCGAALNGLSARHTTSLVNQAAQVFPCFVPLNFPLVLSLQACFNRCALLSFSKAGKAWPLVQGLISPMHPAQLAGKRLLWIDARRAELGDVLNMM